MAISILHAIGSAADSSDNATTTAVDTTGATLLVLACTWFNGTTVNPTVSDSKGNTWTGLTQQNNETATSIRIWYVNSATPTVGSGHTFQIDGTEIYPVI